ncbi:hypothetical protein CP532_1374 [Ophiocordyceps camponoti-leonardi (nom. inval.)]|nr:hypothetical protein CP532_1374 [Ophiocordyceps camponoti-leonardi (nom. inval.)]
MTRLCAGGASGRRSAQMPKRAALQPNMSLSSDGSVAVPRSKAYMDSLVPPDREQFEHIAQVQKARELESRRRRAKSPSLSQSLSLSTRRSDDARNDAARVIQKTFRGYRTRRELDGLGLDASTRWVAAIREAQFRQSIKPRAAPGQDLPGPALPTLDDPIDVQPWDARRKWKKASLVVRHAGQDDEDGDETDGDETDDASTASSTQRAEARRKREQANRERREAAKMMGLQYFLEMVDVKHRYGSNLRMYHEEWKKSDTTDNFFFWLDYGDGRKVELDLCPRDRLEREQVRYLSREERQAYLVRIDDDGRLCWARNGDRIDTTEQFKNSAHGIVPVDDPTPAFSPQSTSSQSSDSESSGDDHHDDHHDAHHDDHHRHHQDQASEEESKREADRAAKYANPTLERAHGLQKVRHLSASTIFNKLLRKSVKKNTWIFVADTSFRLYVGIKESGVFQHSSFLQGGRISAAGLIKIKNGRLSSLSPLSGHYRPLASNFKAFVRNLREVGVDMSHVSISKSYAVLVGLETYVKTRRKGKNLVGKLIREKDKMVAPDEFRKRQEAEKDKSESAEKERLFLEKQQQQQQPSGRRGSIAERVLPWRAAAHSNAAAPAAAATTTTTTTTTGEAGDDEASGR